MRAPLALAGALVLAGLVVLGLAVSAGQATVALVLVFPVVVATGPLGLLGALLVVAGVVVVFIGFAMRIPPSRGPLYGSAWDGEPPPSAEDEWDQRVMLPRGAPRDPQGRPPRELDAPRRSGGGFILLGPIPIAFGTTRGLAAAMLLLALAALALLVVLPLLLRGPA